MTIPTITTDRLILRPPVLADFPAYASLWASPRSAYMGGPYNTFSAWGLFCHDIALWTMFGHGALMLDLATSGECIGQVGINHGPLFPEPELGWLIYEPHEGRGYVSEAARAMRDWARTVRRLPTLVSYIDPANARSIAVAERLGAVRDPDAARPDPDDLVFRHFPPLQA